VCDGKRPLLLTRYAGNPILTAADWPHTVNAVFNPGAIRLADGTTLLFCRVEDRRGISSLWAARSQNGVDGWTMDAEPTFPAEPERHPEEAWGVEDARITWIQELGKYAVTYTAFGRTGPSVSLALTTDFHEFERLGPVMPPEDKDAALLPRRIDGRWFVVHRPTTTQGANIYLSESPDLIHWGRHRLVLAARLGPWWDARRVGLGSPPIETAEGWLMLYHGVHQTAAGGMYRLGLALLDREEPWRCVRRSDEWIFGPRETYERTGDVGDVVFPCGHTIGPDGDSLNLYYGAADTSIALATGRVSELLSWLKGHSRHTCDSLSVD
jgi:predicted GH43/DUF377 family glycosyl hydrolase